MTTHDTYEYKVRDARGSYQEGKVEGSSDAAVADKLREMGYTPLEVRVKSSGGCRASSRSACPKRVKIKDVAIFSRQFATMIGAGLSMIRSLTILSEQTENEALRKVIRAVKSDVEQGKDLSDAMARHPKVFRP